MSENKNIINEQEPQDDHMIEGRNAVLEAFRAGKTIDKLYIQDGLRDGVISSILRDAKKKDVIVNFVSKEKLDQMSPDRKHQGVMAITAAFSYAEVDDILEKAKEKGEDPFIFILDEIEDPHNLGAIIRTANLCGAHGVIIPKRRAVGLTATVVKASAGAIHYTPVAKVTNIVRTIEELKEKGVIVADLKAALTEHRELFERYYMQKAVKADENRLTAQHAAKVTSGALIYIPENTIIEKPITTYFIQDATKAEDYVHHVLLIADSCSEVSYLENLLTVGNNETTANIIVEVIARPGSHVKFASFDRLGENTTTYLNRRGYLEQDAKIDWSMGMMNDGNIVGDFDSDLIGNGSHAEVKVVAITTGKQVQGIDTRVTNYGKHSIGHILQHGVILAKSSLIFNGIGHIIHGLSLIHI